MRRMRMYRRMLSALLTTTSPARYHRRRRRVRADEALAASRSADAAVRVDTVTATNGVIRAVEEYRLVFSSARRY
jgi:hypothetical protein